MSFAQALVCPKCNTTTRRVTGTCPGCQRYLTRTPAASSSTLLYLFADQIVPKSTVWTRILNFVLAATGFALMMLFSEDESRPPDRWALWLGLAVLALGLVARILRRTAGWTLAGGEAPSGHGIMVQKRPFAIALFAAAFWSLREQGHITLEPVENALWRFFDATYLIARRIERNPTGDPHLGGLEQAILESIPARGSSTVEGIVDCWLGEPTPDPWGDIVTAVGRVAGDLGWLAEGQFEDFAARWERFQRDERALYRTLLRNCGRCIAAKQLVDDAD